MNIDDFIDKIRSRSNPYYNHIYKSYKSFQKVTIPVPMSLARAFYSERIIRTTVIYWLLNKFYYEPMLRSKCLSVGKHIMTDGDIPLITGSGKIIIGSNVRIGNSGSWILSPNLYECPELVIGDNTSINYKVVISVESKVYIGNNCSIAGETSIFDNNSHSILYLNDRRMTNADVSPITIEDHVLIGMKSIICKGVTIGRGSFVAAGSVVTKSVPPMTLVAGNPARIVKEITLPK